MAAVWGVIGGIGFQSDKSLSFVKHHQVIVVSESIQVKWVHLGCPSLVFDCQLVMFLLIFKMLMINCDRELLFICTFLRMDYNIDLILIHFKGFR